MTDARTRAADLYQRFAAWADAALRRRYPGADPDRVADAVVDGLLALAADDGLADGDDGELKRRIYRHAKDRLRVAFRSERRLKVRERKKAERTVTTVSPADLLPLEEAADPAFVRELRDEIARTADERAALDRYLSGETAPAAIAAALGWGDSAAAAAQAHRLLARLRQRLCRARARANADTEDRRP